MSIPMTDNETRDRLEEALYAFLGDRTISPTGYEWEHGRLQRLTTDLLAVLCHCLPETVRLK